ncbi:stress response protein NST1-like isoform X2 [Sphaeramia orbicularis]|uniref:stress response protein NST1-like isoform X2 n=1 Tax=Sphaeramia orbicularis TaxID=375764 RepID=UPI00118020CF|nr:stress response protein NST1-like isoform X2 [Sphaeramia orbicularis]
MDAAEETHEVLHSADQCSAPLQQILTENMEEKLLEENEQMLSIPKQEEEEMEVTVSTRTESSTVASNYTETPAQVQVKYEPEAEMFITHTDSTGVMLSVDSVWNGHAVCKKEDFEDDNSDNSSSSTSASSSSPFAPVLDYDDDDEGFSQPAPTRTRDKVLFKINKMAATPLRIHLRYSEQSSTPGADRDLMLEEQKPRSKTTKWREKMKRRNPDRYKLFQEQEALRAKYYRLSMSDERRKKSNELAAVRMQKRRERLRLESDKKEKRYRPRKTNVETRKETGRNLDQRQKWARQKREQREMMSAQKKQLINEKRRKQYAEKKEEEAKKRLLQIQ